MVGALFDSNILIDHLKGLPEAAEEIALYTDRAFSIVTWIEVMAGVQPDQAAHVRAFLEAIPAVPLTPAIAERAVTIRRESRLRLPDAVIWATAQVEGRLLVTRNTRDFPANAPDVRHPYPAPSR